MRKALAFLGIPIAAAIVAAVVFGATMKRSVRHRTETYLSARFQSQVQFSHFDMDVFPRIRLTLDNVVMRHHGRTDVPPLIQMKKLTIIASLTGLLGDKSHVRSVVAEGLEIHTPPHEQNQDPTAPKRGADFGSKRDPSSPSNADANPPSDSKLAKFARKYPVVIDDLRADDTQLTILRSDPNKSPRIFAIHHLELYHANFDEPSSFEAILTNPAPQGEIHCTGTFGPWNAELPRRTPVHATYTFKNADMGTIKGLSGTLSSKGRFGGPLDYLDAEGTTDTADFALRTSSHPMDLQTHYSAIVDGTNGDVILKSVQANFLNSQINATGKVVDETNAPGRTIVLDADASSAQMGDLLQLAVKTPQPAMTGSTRLKARIEIPEGSADLIERLRLAGTFAVSDTHFTNPKIEAHVQTLSRKGQGKPKDESVKTDTSDLHGKFHVAKGVVAFSDLGYGVTGASIRLAGTYDMNSGQMDFRGKLRLRAELSQTMTGIKSLALKPFNHFFKGRNAGTVVPIRITGTKDHPAFALDFHDDQNRE